MLPEEFCLLADRIFKIFPAVDVEMPDGVALYLCQLPKPLGSLADDFLR